MQNSDQTAPPRLGPTDAKTRFAPDGGMLLGGEIVRAAARLKGYGSRA